MGTLKIEDMSHHLTTLQHMKETYENKITTLESEIESLKQLTIKVSNQEEEIADNNEIIRKLEKQIEDLQESGQNYDPKYLEQIEHLRLQLKEKCDIIEASESDAKLKEKLSKSLEDVELKTQELENMMNLIRQLEADKLKLELKISEVEQYRQEVSKEANQHMEETGEKIKELKVQFELKQEECNNILKENEKLKNDYETIKDDYTQMKEKYTEVVNNSTNSEIIKERDVLKDKNEKLTNMCKKYIAKVKQLESSNTESNRNNDSRAKIEELHNKISDLETSMKEKISENNILLDDMSSKYQVIENLQNQLAVKEHDIKELTNSNIEKDEIILRKDDVVRELKQKLEESPEMNTVQVDMQQSADAHQQTKSELNSLKEKCKKLIVKVKQQDAQLKELSRSKNISDESDKKLALDSVNKEELNQLKLEKEELLAEKSKFMEDKKEYIMKNEKELSKLVEDNEKLQEENENVKKQLEAQGALTNKLEA